MGSKSNQHSKPATAPTLALRASDLIALHGTPGMPSADAQIDVALQLLRSFYSEVSALAPVLVSVALNVDSVGDNVDVGSLNHDLCRGAHSILRERAALIAGLAEDFRGTFAPVLAPGKTPRPVEVTP